MNNWIDTLNPFGLPRPPAWFLADLALYDPELVVFPSVEVAFYRLARRARRGPGALRALAKHPDTKVYVANRLVPVKSFYPPTISLDLAWGRILPELTEYDVHRAGGADAASDRLDGMESEQEQKNRARTADLAGVLARESYGPAKAEIGERVSFGSYRPRPRVRPTFRHSTLASPSRKPTPGGLVIATS